MNNKKYEPEKNITSSFAQLRRFRSTPIACFFALIMTGLALASSANSLELEGETVPDFSAYDQDGTLFRLSENSDKTVILHICAVWCAPCQALAQAHSSIAAELDGTLGVDSYVLVDLLLYDNGGSPSTQPIAQLWKSIFATPATILHVDGASGVEEVVDLISDNGVYALPTNLIIDGDRKVLASFEGFGGQPAAFAEAIVEAIEESVLDVSIDIRPNSDQNVINLSSAGVVPIAILSDANFAAPDIAPATINLAGAGVKLLGKGDRFGCSVEDVNADGYQDLTCRITTADFLIEEGQSIAVLEASTSDGRLVRGEDFIRIVP